MNVVDSSGWLEYFTNSMNADFFSKPVEDAKSLIVPSIIVVEVFKKVLKEFGEPQALKIVAHMRQGKVVDLNLALGLDAARFGVELKLPLADSIIWATTHYFHATLWTQDDDFKNLPGVRYISKSK